MRQVKKLQAELAESRNEFATLSKACGNWREFNAPAEPSNADISHSRD
jgi:hypothetical protein